MSKIHPYYARITYILLKIVINTSIILTDLLTTEHFLWIKMITQPFFQLKWRHLKRILEFCFSFFLLLLNNVVIHILGLIRGEEGGGIWIQPSRKQCTNGTYNPNFALKIGIISPWYVFSPKIKKIKLRLTTAVFWAVFRVKS